MSKLFTILFWALLLAKPADAEDARTTLRAAEAKLASTPSMVFVYRITTNKGETRYCKCFQYWTPDLRLNQRIHESKETLKEALESDGTGDRIQMLYRGDEMWVLGIAKKVAYQIISANNPMADFSRQSELKQKVKCAIDYYNDSRLSYQIRDERTESATYRVVTRHIEESARRQFRECGITPTGIINSIVTQSATALPANTYPSDIEYRIDTRGYIMSYRSMLKGRLISVTNIEWCESTSADLSSLMDVPSHFAVKVVKADGSQGNLLSGF